MNKEKVLLLPHFCKTVSVAQSVRASDCGSEGRGFEPHHSPESKYGEKADK